MKIAVLDAAAGGGIGRHALEVAKHVKASDHEVTCIVREAMPGSNLMTDKYRAADLDIAWLRTRLAGRSLEITPLMTLVLTVVALFRVLRTRGPDVVYCVNWFPSGVASLLLEPVGGHDTVVVVHGAEVVYGRDDGLLKRASRPLQRWTLANADLVFAVSEYTRDRIEELGVEDVRICKNGVDPANFTISDGPPSSLPADALEGPTLLTVARLQRYKGHDRVLEAIARLQSEFPDLTYLIAGSGEAREELEAIAADLGVEDNVFFLGYVPETNLSELYSAADVFVMPTRIGPKGLEGFGIAYLEANACETPVVGTTEGGASTAIEAGETGLLADPRDAEDIADSIRELLDNPERAASMGQAGRRRVETELSWEQVTADILREIERATAADHSTSRS